MNCATVIFTAITAIATTGLFIYGIIQSKLIGKSIQESIKARTATVLLEIYKYLNDLSPKWHKVLSLTDNHSKWTKKEKSLAYDVALEFQRISFIVYKELIHEDLIIDAYGKDIINCWEKLKQYIKEYRVECGEPSELSEGGYQRKHFEILANKCKEKFQKQITA